jgi:hypothetical protein
MSIPLNNLILFFPSLFFGITMLLEGFLIVKMEKQIIPLPSKLLYWVGIGLIGKEQSTKWFAGKNTPENLRIYAIFAFVFGISLVISSLIYLDWTLLL